MTFALGLSAALIGYNAILNVLGTGSRRYVPINLAATAAVVGAGRRAGLSFDAMGLSAGGWRRGLQASLPMVGAAMVGLGAGALTLRTRPLLRDQRVAGIGPGELLYRAFVRIPFGTVLLEEVAFRGVMDAAWRRCASDRTAEAAGAVTFGLWHVVPAVDLARTNGLDPIRTVCGAVTGTALGGVFLGRMRRRTGGVWGPAFVHAGVNAAATVAAFTAHRR